MQPTGSPHDHEELIMKPFASIDRGIRRPLAAAVTAAVAAASLCNTAFADPATVGAVYAMTNTASDNAVIVYNRGADGMLAAGNAYATGGDGLGAALGSQGAVKLSPGGRWLFAVNAGSNEVSVFAVDRLGLVLTDKVASGGTEPVSVTIHGNRVYVLNAGSDSVSGFTLDWNGKLTPVPGSVHALSGSGVGGAEVEFSPDGAALVVTEKATDNILVFPVGGDGLLGDPATYSAATPTPFGFAFGRYGEFFVSEANPDQPGESTLASYRLKPLGGARMQNPSATTHQSRACWVAVMADGRYVYTSNPASNSLTGFRVGPAGRLTLLDGDGLTASTGDGSSPLDIAMDRFSRHLYSINPGNGTISAFSVAANGALQPLQTVSAGLPPEAYGLAAQ
jgi:6-phosphogluconolactonase (cycloisomerase 2 family)